MELKLLHTAAIGWNGSRDDKKWRIKAIPRMIKAGMDRTAVLEQQLRIFVDEHPSHPGHKSSPHVKGVIIDGVISHDDNVVKKAIKDFWESLLSTERPYNNYPKSLTSELMQLQLLQVGLKRMEHVL